jgi:hypothetical protein
VDELFRLNVVQSESATAPELQPGDVAYGFSAHTGSNILITRWNAQQITFWQATPVSDQDVTKALQQGVGK